MSELPPHRALGGRSMDRLLRPRSIAIVGASPTPGAFGWSVLRNLEQASFAGELYLVNPKRAEIDGRPCFASVAALPPGVDCAVLAIPRAGVLPTLAQCAAHGVGAAVIFSAGFAESGEQGLAEQQKIGELARHSGMIVEGPNCLGFVNFVDRIPLTFVANPAERFQGSTGIAIVSQSGAMAAVLGVSLRHRALGISFSVSTGNEAVTGVEDFVEYMIADPHTQVIAMIVEQFRQPRRFLTLAATARAAGKHIVLLHPGSSGAARASAATHTGAMAGNYDVMRVTVAHAGVLAVGTLEELADVADILVRCPVYKQGGAAVFTESGAFKALSLDFCERLGLALPPLDAATDAGLRAVLPDFIPPSNPLDITAQGLVDPDIYRRTLPPVLASDLYGSVLLSIILSDEKTSALKFPPILAAIREITPTKPVLFAAMDEGASVDPHFIEELRALGVPFFPSPERAFRALARITAHGSPKPTTASDDETPETHPLESGIIPEHKSKHLLAAYGIPVPAGELATTLDQAHQIARRIGFPVVLKAQAAALTHKSDVGGVALHIRDAEQLTAAWAKMYADIQRALPGLVLDGLLVETMGKLGVELIVGAQNDPEWGIVLLVGFGGVLAEALHDVRLLPPNLSRTAIERELHTLKSAALLSGFRGSPPLDVAAAAQIVQRLGGMMLANPAIREVDINPVIVYPIGEGAVALDALIVAD